MSRNKGLRGLSNIRTMSTRSAAEAPRHEVFTRITSLEMERTRKRTEREAAARRLEAIDARLAAIDAEVAELLDCVEPSERPRGRGPRPTQRGGFTFRY